MIQENKLSSDELQKIALIYAENFEEEIDDPDFLRQIIKETLFFEKSAVDYG